MRSLTPSDPRSIAAVHESAHACAAALTESLPFSAAIDDRGGGCVLYANTQAIGESVLRSLGRPVADSAWIATAIIDAAGAIAQRRFTGTAPTGADKDLADLTTAIAERADDAESAVELTREIIDATEAIVLALWEPIRRVAQALAERGQLDGDEIKAAMKRPTRAVVVIL